MGPLNPVDEAIQSAKERAGQATWFAGGMLAFVLYLAFRRGKR
jgi:hypothetical protein